MRAITFCDHFRRSDEQVVIRTLSKKKKKSQTEEIEQGSDRALLSQNRENGLLCSAVGCKCSNNGPGLSSII
ncbi:hypothetical protein Q1695_006829 [Nippostrongylus brasiliensis]|nr:hypothetical protein Q1695_006829 [Nippostrongylus brasiliensis]